MKIRVPKRAATGAFVVVSWSGKGTAPVAVAVTNAGPFNIQFEAPGGSEPSDYALALGDSKLFILEGNDLKARSLGDGDSVIELEHSL